MKICAIICEYNPFHNGHAYLIGQALKRTDCDSVLCLMSGNFVQRGEAAVLSKYARARHAVLAGADAVIELPVVFASSPAEFFARGAVRLLSSVPEIKYLCFGCESGETTDFSRFAGFLNDEPKEVSDYIRNRMKTGISYVKARTEAWKIRFPDFPLSSPNDILAVEYARAICREKADIRLIPVQRIGKGHSDGALSDGFSSSSGIRAAVRAGKDVSENIPDFVAKDLVADTADNLPLLEKLALLRTSAADLEKVCDCTEGLENALKREAENNSPDIVNAVVSRRYTASRIRRILLQNLLDIREIFIRECLERPLYLNLLAIKKERKDLLTVLGNAEFPLLVRAGDDKQINGTAKLCLEKDRYADKIFLLARNVSPEKKNIFIG